MGCSNRSNIAANVCRNDLQHTTKVGISGLCNAKHGRMVTNGTYFREAGLLVINVGAAE
jgi:hypothetical protein